jgi:uncharacterized protein (TIGR00730 family)
MCGETSEGHGKFPILIALDPQGLWATSKSKARFFPTRRFVLTSMQLKRLCVFCGSSAGHDPVYAKTAHEFGLEMAGRNLTLVYGGGNIGLMGIVADAVLAGGGKVIGVIPRFLQNREIAHNGLTELRLVDSMHERKALMADLSDGFVALPGGFGTLDELCEILTWAQLQLHAKPCAILNIQGFFAPFLAQIQTATQTGFIRPEHVDLLRTASNPSALLDQISAVPASDPRHQKAMYGSCAPTRR